MITCPRCQALVANLEKHMAWHRKYCGDVPPK